MAVDEQHPRVSVIIPTRNSGGEELHGVLGALAAQTVAPDQFEIVIADDGSTDGSTDGLDDGERIRVTVGPPRSSYAARNRGVSVSKGEILAFCDADCRPAPNWLEAGIAALNGTDVVAGHIRLVPPANRTVWTLLDLENKNHAIQVKDANAETANLFVRRSLFDRLKGFDDSLPEHGDFDFVTRAVQSGGKLEYVSAAVVTHPTRNKAKPFLRNLWIMNRWYAAREARAGRMPMALRPRTLLPIIPTIRARRRFNSSLSLDPQRLRDAGVRPTLREHALALPLLYVVVPYLRAAAQLSGWWEGRRLRNDT